MRTTQAARSPLNGRQEKKTSVARPESHDRTRWRAHLNVRHDDCTGARIFELLPNQNQGFTSGQRYVDTGEINKYGLAETKQSEGLEWNGFFVAAAAA